jgi:hypothetical protein
MSRTEKLGLKRIALWFAGAALLVSAGCSSSTQSSRTCTEEQCGEFGSCGEVDGGSACVCDEGYAGEDCADCADGYAMAGGICVPEDDNTGDALCEDDPCNGHGSCDGSSGEVQCECAEGYTGDDCSECDEGYHADGDECVEDETCRADSCPDNATCDDSTGVIVCECDEGYSGDDCDECAAGYHDDGGECVEDTSCRDNTCPNGSCDDSSGVPVCTCNPGYAGEHCDECDAGYHADGDECVEDQVCGPDSCPPNASCDDTGGVIECTCNEGYQGDDCSECDSPFVSGPDGSCLEPCPNGLFYGEDGECTLTCPEETTLVDVATINPSQVPVPEGYELVPPGTIVFPDGSDITLFHIGTLVCVPLGYTCDQYDPCGGSDWGHCNDESGLPVCICDAGYVGFSCGDCDVGFHPDGDACLEDETCTADSCSGAGTCDDSTGQIDCSCNAGFDGNDCEACAEGYHPDSEGVCVEDEVCGDCGGHGSCQLVEGLATCTCFVGYTGEGCADCEAGYHADGSSCVKDTVCTETTCSGHGTCTALDGETDCDPCDPGYAGENCGDCADGYTRANGVCVALPDPTSCMPNPCNGGTCNNTNGTITCTCPSPYAGSRCQSCLDGYVKWPDGVCRPSSCGDGIRDGRAGEECDPGSPTRGDCAYGLASCEVCGGPPPVVVQVSGIAGHPMPAGTTPPPEPSPEPSPEPVEEPEPAPAPAPTSPYDPENHCKVVPGIPHYCGDGDTDAQQETCDDGPPAQGCSLNAQGVPQGDCTADNADACLVTCDLNVCGDGIVNPLAEACDDGVNDSVYGEVGGCAAGCIAAPYCGDTAINGTEQCDDGNVNDSDACLSTCQSNACGDGFVRYPNGSGVGTNCDEGQENSAYCDYDTECGTVCLPEACGDACTVADGIAQYCGDGIINGDEECDLGQSNCQSNTSALPSSESVPPCCDDACTVENGAGCGDGYCEAGEEVECATDCACGNGVCDANERSEPIGPIRVAVNGLTPLTYCPTDCVGCCDGVCSTIEAHPESPQYCEQDCYCGDGVCSDYEGSNNDTTYCAADCCGDDICSSTEGEWSLCDDDCTVCGDGFVEGDEECDDGTANGQNYCPFPPNTRSLTQGNGASSGSGPTLPECTVCTSSCTEQASTTYGYCGDSTCNAPPEQVIDDGEPYYCSDCNIITH